jgi:hypothetical protein
MAAKKPKPEDVPLGSGMAEGAKKKLTKRQASQKRAACYGEGYEYDATTGKCK